MFVAFTRGRNAVLNEEKELDNERHFLIVIDDLATYVFKNIRCSEIFTHGIHHRNVSVLLLLQNHTSRGKSRGTLYFVCNTLCFSKIVQDVRQIGVLA